MEGSWRGCSRFQELLPPRGCPALTVEGQTLPAGSGVPGPCPWVISRALSAHSSLPLVLPQAAWYWGLDLRDRKWGEFRALVQTCLGQSISLSSWSTRGPMCSHQVPWSLPSPPFLKCHPGNAPESLLPRLAPGQGLQPPDTSWTQTPPRGHQGFPPSPPRGLPSAGEHGLPWQVAWPGPVERGSSEHLSGPHITRPTGSCGRVGS